jgi:SAM-dependent methyltransferase
LEIIKSSPGKCVLDVQGVTKDHWAWQMALDSPEAMIYGLKLDPSKTIYTSPPNHEGPSNYIPFVGHSLAHLPFDDNFFDVVSAKTLWYLLRKDQWDQVFRELYRIIKPGGVLELLQSDFAILNRSPVDRNLWEQFQRSVEIRNIEPKPTLFTAGKLAATGFVDIQRAMIALPRGWGGQIGHMTDFLSSFYVDSLLRHYGDLMPDEVESFKRRSSFTIDMGYHEAGSFILYCATKPKVPVTAEPHKRT